MQDWWNGKHTSTWMLSCLLWVHGDPDANITCRQWPITTRPALIRNNVQDSSAFIMGHFTTSTILIIRKDLQKLRALSQVMDYTQDLQYWYYYGNNSATSFEHQKYVLVYDCNHFLLTYVGCLFVHHIYYCLDAMSRWM